MMRKLIGYVAASCIVAAIGVATVAHADSMMGSSSMKTVIFTPSNIKWMPGTGELKGLPVAMLDGDPSKAGPWTMRIKIPAGTKFPVHYHNDTERITVISGTFEAAIGDKYDASKLVDLPAGSFVIIPAGVRHYAMTKTDCVLQLSGTAPFAMKMDKGSM